MPQEFYYPTSTATSGIPYDGLNNGGGANKNASTRPSGGRSGPMSHDDGTTYIAEPTGGFGPNYQSLNPDFPSPMVSYNGVLTLGFRHASDGSYFCQRKLYMANGGGTLGTVIFDTGLVGGGWTTSGPADITNTTYRPGGGSWVLSDFDDSTSVFPTVSMNTGDVNATGYCTSIWGEISYSPPSGGFIFLLGLAGLMALPYLGLMTDYNHFNAYLNWRQHNHPRATKWDSETEKLEAWSDVKAYRYPTFFFP